MSNESVTLVIKQGPRRGDKVTASGPRFSIGRDEQSGLSLADDDYVSRLHCEIVWTASGPEVKNRSANGTLVNGARVEEAKLKSGDEIAIGASYVLSVAEVTASSPSGRATSKLDPRGSGKAAAKDDAPAASKKKLPLSPLLLGYLVVMGLVLIALTAWKLFGGESQVGLQAIVVEEMEFVEEEGLDLDEAKTIQSLLELADLHERRGDYWSAYKTYEKVLSMRQPNPYAPSYLYAMDRMSEIGAVE